MLLPTLEIGVLNAERTQFTSDARLERCELPPFRPSEWPLVNLGSALSGGASVSYETVCLSTMKIWQSSGNYRVAIDSRNVV